MESTQVYNGPPPSHGSTSSSLLERVKARDPQAWERLASVYGPTLLLWCRHAGLSADDAADVVQETELRTWTAFWQSAVDGRKAADIAADLGMTKRAVRQAKYRVLHRLRQEMDGLLE